MPEIILLKINKIETNQGQIEGVPKNPRFIRDSRFEALKKSIEDFPEMLALREIVVFPWKRKFVCLGGNKRFLACQELGYREIPAKVLPKDFAVEKLREFAIKDNLPFGENDLEILKNEWSDYPLEDWGFDTALLQADQDLDLDLFFDEPKETTDESFEIKLRFVNKAARDETAEALEKIADNPAEAVRKLLNL